MALGSNAQILSTEGWQTFPQWILLSVAASRQLLLHFRTFAALNALWRINLCESYQTDTGANEMMPDELIKILKRYLRESNQSERLVAARIGVNHHTLHHWLTSDERKFSVGRVLPQRVGYM